MAQGRHVQLTWRNLSQFNQALARLDARVLPAAAGALYREAERIMTVSKGRTPVRTGALRASSFVELPVILGRTITVTMGAGGPSAPYATFVHEMVQLHHTVGEAKFLEKSIREALLGMDERLARDIGRGV